jgi:hypothetical protein
MMMGGGLLALVVPIVIPVNYEHGIAPAIATTLILSMLAFIFVASLYLFISDIRRLREIEKHIIVITDEAFVKQEGAKIILVPLAHVRYVTARGHDPLENQTSVVIGKKDKDAISPLEIPSMRENMLGMFIARRTTGATKTRRKRMRTPTSLAFIDTRTEQEVTVVYDNAYGDPFFIAAVLKERAAAVTAIHAG